LKELTMPVLTMTSPDVLESRPSLVLQFRDAFSDSNVLRGTVTVTVGKNSPSFQKESEATFVFANLANGSYMAKVSSITDQPYYLPVTIPITLPFPAATDSPWPQPWPGYPNVTLADPTRLLDDPGQTRGVPGAAQTHRLAAHNFVSVPFRHNTRARAD
jgi:hypothetical protein